MDSGRYDRVRELYEELIAEGHDEIEVTRVFCQEGANPLNIPAQSHGGSYMLKAVMDPHFS